MNISLFKLYKSFVLAFNAIRLYIYIKKIEQINNKFTNYKE